MITAVETKQRFREDPKYWEIALMDFVDDFRFTAMLPPSLSLSLLMMKGVMQH
jgi:hypothetical protein